MKNRDKIGVVMGEYKRGMLRSGSGQKVTHRDQALAIAMSEQRKHDNLKGGMKPKPRA